MALKSHGITTTTPDNLLYSAGTIYKNLVPTFTLTTDTALVTDKVYYTQSGTTPNFVYTKVASPSVGDIATYYEFTSFSGTVLGATSGGIKVAIVPEYVDPELDGANVAVKGIKKKVSEKATIESMMTEFTEGIVKDALHLTEDTAGAIAGYTKYISKRSLESTDYLTNVAYVATLVSGKQVIYVFPNALCTSAFEVEGKNKTQATYKINYECTASPEQDDLEHLPYEIYYPKVSA